jgi:hypothetical protein
MVEALAERLAQDRFQFHQIRQGILGQAFSPIPDAYACGQEEKARIPDAKPLGDDGAFVPVPDAPRQKLFREGRADDGFLFADSQHKAVPVAHKAFYPVADESVGVAHRNRFRRVGEKPEQQAQRPGGSVREQQDRQDADYPHCAGNRQGDAPHPGYFFHHLRIRLACYDDQPQSIEPGMGDEQFPAA